MTLRPSVALMRFQNSLASNVGQGLCVVLPLIMPLFAAPGRGNCRLADPESAAGIDLELCRPAPLSPEEKAAVLASLPRDGEITALTGGEREKLAFVDRFLATQHRRGVYAVKVIDPAQAWVGLHGRAVLLITRSALRLLSAAELTAIVAHEVGHEYVYSEYGAAKAAGNSSELKRLELTCDALAVAMLKHPAFGWEPLAPAFEALARYNLEHFGTPLNNENYPPTKERRKLIDRVSRTLLSSRLRDTSVSRPR